MATIVIVRIVVPVITVITVLYPDRRALTATVHNGLAVVGVDRPTIAVVPRKHPLGIQWTTTGSVAAHIGVDAGVISSSLSLTWLVNQYHGQQSQKGGNGFHWSQGFESSGET